MKVRFDGEHSGVYEGLEPTRRPEERLRALAEAVPRATRPTDGAVGVPM